MRAEFPPVVLVGKSSNPDHPRPERYRLDDGAHRTTGSAEPADAELRGASFEPLESRRLLTAAHEVLALVPTSAVDAQVVASGDWSDPAIWANSALPDAGDRILIPAEFDVTYDLATSPDYFTLRVDGELHFATDVSTGMTLDTLVVTESGTLTIGTSASPVVASATAHLTFTTDEAIDTSWDPTLMSRGLLSLGTVEIHGASKTTFIETAADPAKGASLVSLESVPQGWKSGDRLVITGATYDPGTGSKDEVRSLAAFVTDTTIALNAPLSQPHVLAGYDVPIMVGNYSRNVIIESRGTSEVPAERRAHVLFSQGPMMRGDVSVQYAEFNRLGRTRKDIRIDDPGGRNIDGTPGTGTNPRARYSLHLHHRDHGHGVTPDIIHGNSVTDSPGWGIVSHASYAHISENVTYGILGSHFSAEDGGERGSFTNNLAVYSPKSSIYRHIKEDASVANFDVGFGGHGFWFQGRNLTVQGNVASGMQGEAFAFFHRYPSKIHRQGYVIKRDTPVEHLISEHRDLMAKGRTSFDANEVPIINFDDNTATTSFSGLTVVKRDAKQYHDIRSTFHNFEAWSVRRGVELQYTGKYTFTGVRLHGDANSSYARYGEDAGFMVDTGTVDAVVNGGLITGFEEGVMFENHTVPYERAQAIFIDLEIITRDGNDPDNAYTLRTHSENPPADLSYFQVLSSDALPISRPSVELAPHQRYTLPYWLGDDEKGSFLLEGIKSDSAGSTWLGEQIRENSDPNLLFREVWKGSYLSNILANGVQVDADGTRYVWLDSVVVDRVTTEAVPFRIKAVIDRTAPTVKSGTFRYEQEQAVQITFSEDVLPSLRVEDLVVTNRATGEVIPASRFILETTGGTNSPTTATWRYDTAKWGSLPNGSYRATLPAWSVKDAAGIPLNRDFILDLTILGGDANRDSRVDFSDFLVLRSNLGRTDTPLFSEADFNYDDKVDFADFLILRSNFGATLPATGAGSLFDTGDGGEDVASVVA